ncbi:hypothetical protein, partial [Mesorhizobium sp. M0060]|uniref:hypothetical protein n=1 Tax=Mesorhizobium sp. M0060 TaxID=2956866 RepID=UPI003334FFA6
RMAASTGRTEDCTRPTRHNVELPLASREPSTEDIASEDSGGRGCALKPRLVDQIEDRIGLAARHRLAELDAAVGLDQTEQGLRHTSTPRSRRSWPLPRRADFLE